MDGFRVSSAESKDPAAAFCGDAVVSPQIINGNRGAPGSVVAFSARIIGQTCSHCLGPVVAGMENLYSTPN